MAANTNPPRLRLKRNLFTRVHPYPQSKTKRELVQKVLVMFTPSGRRISLLSPLTKSSLEEPEYRQRLSNHQALSHSFARTSEKILARLACPCLPTNPYRCFRRLPSHLNMRSFWTRHADRKAQQNEYSLLRLLLCLNSAAVEPKNEPFENHSTPFLVKRLNWSEQTKTFLGGSDCSWKRFSIGR